MPHSMPPTNPQLPLFVPAPEAGEEGRAVASRPLPSWLESLCVILLMIGVGFAWVGFESHRLAQPQAAALRGPLAPSAQSSQRLAAQPIHTIGATAKGNASDGTSPRTAFGPGLVGRRL